jgi:thermostable 8-oxoguanine DNA glycosylase
MVDPTKITDFNRSKEQLEELLLFCILVAGKTASIQARKLDLFLKKHPSKSPFKLIEHYLKKKTLLEEIKEAKLGQYSRLERAFAQVIKLDVFNCTIEELESITGIGPKTARFYILHSRANQQVAVLDTHLLKWLRDELGLNAPKSTPSSKQYLVLEKEFLNYCKKHKKNPATLDLEIWNKYSSGS